MQPIEAILGNKFPRTICRAYGETAAIAPAANANLGVFRWTFIPSMAVITRAWVNVNVVTAVTAQRTDPLRLFIARAYTARDATNATAIALSAAMQKLRTGYADTLGAALAPGPYVFLDVASAAAGVTGGTKTPDTTAIGSKAFSTPIAGPGTGMEGDIFNLPAQGGTPIQLQPQAVGGGEGVILQWGATALATGTVTVGFGVEWAEAQVP